MAKAVHRQGDSTTGHGCWPPTVPASYASTVYANGKLVVRKGDSIVTHCCTSKPYPCHSGNYTGTRSVFVEGSELQAVGDPISCGDSVAAGSSNVYTEG